MASAARTRRGSVRPLRRRDGRPASRMAVGLRARLRRRIERRAMTARRGQAEETHGGARLSLGMAIARARDLVTRLARDGLRERRRCVRRVRAALGPGVIARSVTRAAATAAVAEIRAAVHVEPR
jgi:hypothetical protein